MIAMTEQEFCLALLASLRKRGVRGIRLRGDELFEKFGRVANQANSWSSQEKSGAERFPRLHNSLRRERAVYSQLFSTLLSAEGRLAAPFDRRAGSYRLVMSERMVEMCLRRLSEQERVLMSLLAHVYIEAPVPVRV
jgi:hypothetical protein